MMGSQPVHHRILFPTQAIRESQLRCDLPAIANIQAVLPIDGIFLLPLEAFGPTAYGSEQVRGPVVELSAAGSAIQTGCAIREKRVALRCRTGLEVNQP